MSLSRWEKLKTPMIENAVAGALAPWVVRSIEGSCPSGDMVSRAGPTERHPRAPHLVVLNQQVRWNPLQWAQFYPRGGCLASSAFEVQRRARRKAAGIEHPARWVLGSS